MKKLAITLLLISGYCAGSLGQNYKGKIDGSLLPVSGSHYEPEFLFDSTTDGSFWLKQSAGLHAAFGSTDQLYFRTDVPTIENENAAFKTKGWRGERLNAQVVVW